MEHLEKLIRAASKGVYADGGCHSGKGGEWQGRDGWGEQNWV
jgi:hypothetical protein